MFDPSVGETPFHHAMEIVTAIGIPTIVGGLAAIFKFLWNSKLDVATLQTTVLTIRDNHLVHLAQDIGGVKADVKEVRGQLISHIENCK
jgi:hypothetical protein